MPNDTPAPTAPSGAAQTELANGIRVLTEIARLDGSGLIWGKAASAVLDSLSSQSSALLALSTERARMERERDEANAELTRVVIEIGGMVGGVVAEQVRARMHEMDMLRDDRSRLTSELDWVRGALTEYGGHNFGCNALKAPGRPCTCGFANALRGLVTPDATTRREG